MPARKRKTPESEVKKAVKKFAKKKAAPAEEEPKKIEVDINLSWGSLLQEIETQIVFQRQSDAPGPVKLQEAVKAVARQVDRALVFRGPLGGLAEAADYYVVLALLTVIVQGAYARMKANGEV